VCGLGKEAAAARKCQCLGQFLTWSDLLFDNRTAESRTL